jgi:translation initiation factor IF-2
MWKISPIPLPIFNDIIMNTLIKDFLKVIHEHEESSKHMSMNNIKIIKKIYKNKYSKSIPCIITYNEFSV